MTVRKSSYRSLASLQRDNARCRACVEAGYPLESWPVRAPYHGQRAYLFGQAPGIVEGEERLPWRGRAGQTAPRLARARGRRAVRDLLLRLGHALLPRAGAFGPRRPDADARASRTSASSGATGSSSCCGRELIVTVGGLALRRLLGIPTLTEAIGKSYMRDGAIVIPLPHPSGASGWLNDRREPRAAREGADARETGARDGYG